MYLYCTSNSPYRNFTGIVNHLPLPRSRGWCISFIELSLVISPLSALIVLSIRRMVYLICKEKWDKKKRSTQRTDILLRIFFLVQVCSKSEYEVIRFINSSSHPSYTALFSTLLALPPYRKKKSMSVHWLERVTPWILESVTFLIEIQIFSGSRLMRHPEEVFFFFFNHFTLNCNAWL